MFKKPLAHQSNATPLRSSARRQLVASVFEQYPTLLPSKDTDGDEADKVSEKEIGKIIVPEGVRTGTFETSAGVEGTLYFSPDSDPLWMSFGRNSKELIPTLYLLAQPLPYPPLPVLQIHNPLPPPLFTGAPFFIPAVRNLSTPWLLPDVPQGGLVAFVTSEGNGAEVSYVGVGRMAAVGGLRGAVDRRMKHLHSGHDADEGKLCDVLCILGDHLWEMGSKPILPSFALPFPQHPLAPPPSPEAGPSRPYTPDEDLNRATQSLQLDDEERTPTRTLPSLEPSDISTLLSVALLQALTNLEASSFPMPASLLYSAHVLPNRPAYIPKERREDVVIAKSEWKKLGKWMKEVGKDGLLKTKETKGEVVIQSFDAQHPALQNHTTFTTFAEEEVKAAKRAARQAATENGDALQAVAGKGKGKEIAIEELWKPGGAAVSFWEAADIQKDALNPSNMLKSALDGYISSRSLVHPTEPRYVLLDDELGRAVGMKRPDPGQSMARDEVMRKLRSGVTWSVSIGGVIKKGALQPITLSVKTRQGRKTVTHVAGLEMFSVDVDEFAEELRKLCAGSASVQPLSGASPKLQLYEILVQGSQVKIITDALVARGVPRRWIKEGEGDKKKK